MIICYTICPSKHFKKMIMNTFSVPIQSRKNKNNFSNWSIPIKIADSMKLTQPEYKYIIISTDDKKLYFEGKFRISSKGKNNGMQIVIPKSFSNEITMYNKKHREKKLNFEIMELTDEKYIKYYSTLKTLRQLHQEFKFGRSPKIHEKFSESLIRYLLNLSKSNSNIYDAVDINDNNIEIKASTTSVGTVTINPNSKFDIIYWLYFNFDEDLLIIKKGKYSAFNEVFSGDKDKRFTVNLSKYLGEDSLYKKYRFDVDEGIIHLI